MSNIKKAIELFRDGYACSQAILAAYCQPLGLSRERAIKIAAGFGGGMHLGGECGALTGVIMVLGLRLAPDNCDTASGRAGIYALVAEFAKRFEARNGSILCHELLGCDIRTPEGMRQAKERNLFKTTCVKIVEDSAMILEEMQMENQSAVDRAPC